MKSGSSERIDNIKYRRYIPELMAEPPLHKQLASVDELEKRWNIPQHFPLNLCLYPIPHVDLWNCDELPESTVGSGQNGFRVIN
jgi:hypothetical protein